MRLRVAICAGILAGLASPSAVDAEERAGEGAAASASTPVIRVLSNRADLLSGGDALVEVVFDSGAAPPGTEIRLDGADVSAQFAERPNGRFMGLVSGLPLGESELSVHLPDGNGAKIALTNHPIEGPVFSGPHLTPWACTLPGADSACNVPPTFRYHYQSVASPGVFQAYDPQSPPAPATVRSITTDHGQTVPYIVREEVGSMNRGIYSVAVLFDPSQPFEPWAPQAGWNGKLFYPFGASCGTNYNQGSEQSVLDDRALSQGFAVATTSLNELGHHCDTVKSAESVMMLKEHIVEDFGEIRYTFGEGLSGGSIGQLQVANAYPGLLQGLIPGLTYPDVWTTAMDVADCYLLEQYYAGPGAALFAAPAQRMAVEGHGTPSVCPAWVALFGANIFPDTGCNAGGAPDYDPDTRPDGCRATVQDIQVNVWGRRPQDGFAHQPYSNRGVQYGLDALNQGLILPEQFLHLNENIGGADIDGNLVPQRNAMNPQVATTAYRAARVDDGRWLDQVAIIDLPSPENAEIHTPYHAFSIEERLVKAHGHGDNHAIWRGGVIDRVAPAFDTMDAWLEAVEADDSATSLAQKIVANRPAADPVNGIGAAEDSCFIAGAQVFDETACDAAWPYFASTRIAAGQDLAKDVLQCPLKTPQPSDYAVGFSESQWQRLVAAFPNGVCDWDAAGDGQQPSQPWVSYTGGPGGEPLGPAPVSMPEPGAAVMLGAGALLLAALRRRSADRETPSI